MLFNLAKKMHIDALKNYSSRNEIPKSFFRTEYRSAPIYDSGSSLGRELTDERVMLLLENETELNRYISRGSSEIHWNGKKLNHFDLILEIAGTNYGNFVNATIKRVVNLFDEQKLTEMLYAIDQMVPEPYYSYKIPEHRKKLIFKIITLRFERLNGLIHEGI
jgi:protein-tyrosine-phosphatase